PADETGQSLNFVVSNTNPALFTVQPAVATDGTLTYTLANVEGSATVTVSLHDNGGTANGGADTSAPPTVTHSLSQAGPPPHPGPRGGGGRDYRGPGDLHGAGRRRGAGQRHARRHGHVPGRGDRVWLCDARRRRPRIVYNLVARRGRPRGVRRLQRRGVLQQ